MEQTNGDTVRTKNSDMSIFVKEAVLFSTVSESNI